jgi:adenylate cyclase class 2
VYEVELKLRADHDAVRERLADLGATRRRRVEQRDTYYDHPDRDFAETDEAFRVRRVHDGDEAETRLTYKGPLVDEHSKTREEQESTVGDGEAVAAMLDRLGFDPAATVAKTREEFALGDHLVALDDVAGVGQFVEVEREVEAGVEAARDEARAVVRDLGLDPDDGIRTSYLEMRLAAEEETADERDEGHAR